MDTIRIHGLEIDCIVGLRPHEREREQRVHIDLALGMDLSAAGRTGRIALTCDYDQIAEEVIALLRFRRYHLIEMATEELAAMLIGVHPALERVEVKLDKPAALDGRARAASVEIVRERDVFPRTVRETAFGRCDVLLETREAGLYRLVVSPGAELPAGFARSRRQLEWLVEGALTSGNTALEAHVPRTADERDEPTSYFCPGPGSAVLFRCTRPPASPGSSS